MSEDSVPVGVKKAAVLCILKSSAGFLLLYRTKEPHLGKYIPIGGKIEPFETPKDAAKREVFEETGINVDTLQLRGIMTETSPTKFNWINYIYTADVNVFPPIKCEEGILEWIAQEQLKDISTPTTDLFIYDYVARYKLFVFDALYNEKIELLELIDELSGMIVFKKNI